jgi:peptidoglycan/xylan/chitin deacetylase (PgdA/CDA1 family)
MPYREIKMKEYQMEATRVNQLNNDFNTSDIFLWKQNTPENFWQTETEFDRSIWNEAIGNALHQCNFPVQTDDYDKLLSQTLGEGRFGESHWNLSRINQIYWKVKPFLPKPIVRQIKKVTNTIKSKNPRCSWPVDDQFVCLIWEIMRQVLLITGISSVRIKNFWPGRNRFSLVLTHDVETVERQSFILDVARLEEKYGFHSSFNIVGEQLPEELTMFNELTGRGFEIGIHGWQHNEKAFMSRSLFHQAAQKIEWSLEKTGAVGMRFPLNLRNPFWMQELPIEYDLSFFDTDPFEPISGGTMSIWPFFLGRFIELPATLTQDNTLVNHLGEDTPAMWMEKIAFIRKYHGMALVNTHPDYLIQKRVWNVYEDFLHEMSELNDCWFALPKDAAQWWKLRSNCSECEKFSSQDFVDVYLDNDQIKICI